MNTQEAITAASTSSTGVRGLVEWSGGAPGLDQRLPAYLPFRASWQMAARSCRRFLHPLSSFRTAGFPQYAWKPAWSLRALPPPSRRRLARNLRSFPGLAQSPDVSVRGPTHRPLAQCGLSSPHLQSLLRPDSPVGRTPSSLGLVGLLWPVFVFADRWSHLPFFAWTYYSYLPRPLPRWLTEFF
jgi:hypothetical protein